MFIHLEQVLAAQTRLAQELHRRPELYELYLIELLTLFADKAVAIQNVKIENHHVKVCFYLHIPVSQKLTKQFTPPSDGRHDRTASLSLAPNRRSFVTS